MNLAAANHISVQTDCLPQTVYSSVFIHLVKIVLLVYLISNPIPAAATILGEIRANSGINETLDAEIPVIKTDSDQPDKIKVRIFSYEDYLYLGIPYDPVYGAIQAQIKQRNNQFYIRLTSDIPVRRSHLELLVEVSWESGFLHRHYSLVLNQNMPDPDIVTDIATIPTPDIDSKLKLVSGPGEVTAQGSPSDPELETLRDQLNLEQEALAANQAENREMRSRIEAIEKKLQAMQKTIELKDNELVNLQQELIISGVDSLPATAAGSPGTATLTSKTDLYQPDNVAADIDPNIAAIEYNAAIADGNIKMKTTGDYSPDWQSNITLSGQLNIGGIQTGQKTAPKETESIEPAAQGLNRGDSTDTIGDTEVRPSSGTESRLKDYLVDLRIDSELKLPGDPGILEVWIGDETYKPAIEADKVVAETSIPAIGQTAKVEPVAPMFKVKPAEFICMKVHPSGSVATFTLTPVKTGKHDVGATVHMYESDDCTGAPVPKSVKQLQVTVRVGAREKAKEYGLQLWEKLWISFLEFWEWAVATFFALIIFLIRKKLKGIFGFEDKPNEG